MRNVSLESDYGQQGHGGRGNRILEPEGVMGDQSFVRPSAWFARARNKVRSVTPVAGNFIIENFDYNFLMNTAGLRAVADGVHIRGRNDQARYGFSLTAPGTGVFRAGFNPAVADPVWSTSNLIAGVMIEWGIPILQGTSFQMEVKAFNWFGEYQQPVSRNFTLRYGTLAGGYSDGESQSSAPTAGIFIFPFVERLTFRDFYGVGAAPGGMSVGIPQAAQIPLWTLDDPGPPPVYSGPANMTGQLTISIPTNLESSFTATARLLSSASPYLALYRQAEAVDEIASDSPEPTNGGNGGRPSGG